MAQSPPATSSPSRLPPILLTWSLMTAVAAAIFGAIVARIYDGSGSDSLPRLMLGVLIGGLIVGGLEWQTLRLYKISMGPLWCGVNAGMLVLIASIIGPLGSIAEGNGLLTLPLWGLMLDVPRWGILRSRLPRAGRWIAFCGLGWITDIVLLPLAGLFTINIYGSTVAYVALNGAINGIWMGLCRGGALMVMLRDRPQ
ncbi:MAG: hypothetical protein AAGF75_05590 [Cyanobacteria bacterium P01_H01_bin.130]